MNLREQVEKQFRMAYQLGSCDPSDCLLCDCNMDDAGREQLASMARAQADEVINAALDAAKDAVTRECLGMWHRYDAVKDGPVLCNLCSNAVDAIENVRGRVT